MKKQITLILCILLILTGSVSAINTTPTQTQSLGDTLFVGGSGPGNYTRIQDAVDDAQDGDTVYVYSGTYKEMLYIDKPLNLIGEHIQTTFIQDGDDIGLHIDRTSNVIVKQFTIQNFDSDIIRIEDSKYIIIEENVITRTPRSGIYFASSENVTIRNNTITLIDLVGISDGRAYNITIEGNHISLCLVGIHLSIHSHPFIPIHNVVKDNTISLCETAMDIDGVELTADISYNKINFNKVGLFLTTSHNTITNNEFVFNRRHAELLFHLGQKTGNTFTQNYWGRPRVLPKIVWGRLRTGSSTHGYGYLPYWKIDWNPRLTPLP